MPDQTIYKDNTGAIIIGLAGLTVMVALLYVAAILPDHDARGILAYFAEIVLGLVVIERLLVYMWSKLTLSSSGIQVINYSTVFSRDSADADWNAVQSSDARTYLRPFKFGTLRIQTADAIPQLVFTWTPNVEDVRAVIDERANLNGEGDDN